MGFKHTPEVEILYDKKELSEECIKNLYKRGYLISKKEQPIKDNWIKVKFNDYIVQIDPLNNYSVKNNNDNAVMIIGMVMDTIEYHMDIDRICKKLLSILDVCDKSNIYEKLYNYIDFLNGRFIILYSFHDGVKLVQDAGGMRTCYYHQYEKIVASHYNLIADITKDNRNKYINTFVNLDPQPWYLPGNSTPYENIFALTPNNELDLCSHEWKRIWPRNNKKDISVNEAIDYIANSISNQMKTLTDNYKIMLSLTKGNDSRISLSTVKNFKDKVICFTSYDGDKNQLIDADFARDFCKKIGIEHIYIDAHKREKKNDDYQRAAFLNHYHSYMYVSIAYYVDALPQDAIFLRSNLIEIVRDFDIYCTLSQKCSYIDYAERNYHENAKNQYVQDMYKYWFEKAQLNKIYNYSKTDILLWEYRYALWLHPSALLRDDIISDTYMLFNCRKILEMGMSMPKYYKQGNILVYEIINRLWPDVGDVIPNTDYTLKDYYSPFDKNNFIPHNDVKIEKGNIYSSNVEVDLFFRKGRYNSEWGFGNNICIKGEYVDFLIDIPIRKKGTNCIQLSVFSSSLCDVISEKIVYSINLDDEMVYSVPLNRFYDKNNNINIIKKYDKICLSKLKIRLLAEENYYSTEKGCCGVLRVSDICVKYLDNIKSVQKIKVISSEELLKEMVYII